MAGWDTAATFGPPEGRLQLWAPSSISIADTLGRPVIRALLVSESLPSEQAPLIQYAGTSFRVNRAPDAPYMIHQQFTHNPADLLSAMQYLRDHLDSLLSLPPNLRASDFQRVAAGHQLEPDHLRRLALWLPALSRYLP